MRTIVITGGSNGIGEATAKRFLNSGDLVYILDKQLPLIAHERFKYIECDVTNITMVESSIKHIHQQQHTIDALISNAGIFQAGTVEETDEKTFDKLINTNLKSHFFLLKNVLPIMKQKQQGTIILVGSETSIVGKKRNAIYGATKAATAQLAKNTALDYAEFGIRVNCICPGTTDTEMYHLAIQKQSKKNNVSLAQIEEEEAAKQPLGRIGQPADIAAYIFFLCSEDASFITGSLQVIDGGYTTG